MSHFHFPRLHFSGKAFIDPATGNNNYHYPLVNFEPISGNVVLPPRIYLDTETNIDAAKKYVADYPSYLKKDENGHSYLELSPISEGSIFKEWMSSPMGSLEVDNSFHLLYENILTEKESIPLKGLCPAYWNYYGTMNFTLSEVRINKIQTIKDKLIQNYETDNSSNPWSSLIDAELSFNFDHGRTSAVMIDVSPTLSLYSQVFCSRITLTNEGQRLMEGKPLKASLRQMNVNRVENDTTITGSSGSFYQTIPISNLDVEKSKAIIEFFTENIQNPSLIKGITIRYDLSEVLEDINPDYKKLGTKSNPAELHINGTIGVYLEDELISHPLGRRLDYLSPYKEKYYLGSSFAFFQKKLNILSLDLIGSLPQMRSENQYELIELNELELRLNTDDKVFHIGLIDVSPSKLSSAKLKSNAGVFDFHIEDQNLIKLLSQHRGRMELCKNGKVLLKEKELRIISDQTGLYADQYDKPEKGFFSNSSKREQCQIKLLLRGKPCLEKIKVMLLKVSVLPYGRGDNLEILDDIQTIKHNQIISWPTDQPGQFFYVFIPTEYDTIPLDIKHHMIKTGEFINLRVLPKFKTDDFVAGQISFEDIYKNILENFDLIYPSSSIITPFNEEHISNRSKFLLKIMDETYWVEYLFMPSSRDLPKGKRKMMFDWIAQQDVIK